jgi:hypothetical protein
MSFLSVKVNRTGGADKFAKNVDFGTALALTRTAKEAQKAVLKAQEETFTIRGNWSSPSNKFGTKVKPAKKTDLTADIHSEADWIVPHEEDSQKTPRSGANLAIPTDNVRRTKRQIIQRSQRPGALRGKNDVVLKTRTGKTMLFQRKGKGKKSRLVSMYLLTPRAHIRKQSTFYAPAENAAKNFPKNLDAALAEAFRTAK